MKFGMNGSYSKGDLVLVRGCPISRERFFGGVAEITAIRPLTAGSTYEVEFLSGGGGIMSVSVSDLRPATKAEVKKQKAINEENASFRAQIEQEINDLRDPAKTKARDEMIYKLIAEFDDEDA